jgi:N-acetylglucosamine kinase-like BadF-type ATPase
MVRGFFIMQDITIHYEHTLPFICGARNSSPRYPVLMRYILGFDGGGTKTECVLMNSADQVLARTFGGPSNPSRIGVEAAVRSVEESADLALRDAGLERSVISAVGAGLAGTAKAEMRERMSCALQERFPGAAVTVLTDLDAALAAAGEGPAIILVAGTGSAAFGRNADGQIARSGGYGPSSSDEGSAYDIGRRAVAAAMQERVGESNSALGKEILAQLGCAEWDVVQHRAQTTPDEIFPPIFPVIGAAADGGDAAAQEILLRASQDLAALVADVAGRLHLNDREFLLVRMGGTMGRSRFFDAHVDAALKRVVPNAQIGKLRVSPAEAAALVAKESDAG